MVAGFAPMQFNCTALGSGKVSMLADHQRLELGADHASFFITFFRGLFVQRLVF